MIWHLETLAAANDYLPRWDYSDNFVIAAPDEQTARIMAHNAYDENMWLDPKLTSCVELKEPTEPAIICYSFNAG